MNILRVIATVDPRSGGPIEGLKLSTKVLQEFGHSSEVVTTDRLNTVSAINDVAVHKLGHIGPRYGYTPKLKRWIAANHQRFDVAVVHGLWNHASIGGWQGLRGVGLPYVVFTHGMMDPWFKDQYPLKHAAKQAFWWLWQGKVLRDSQEVLFTSLEEKKLARGVFSGYSYKERVVSYGAAEPPAALELQVGAFHEAVPSLAGRPFILFLSRVHEKKGCDLLVSAFAQIADRFPNIDLVIAGPDQDGLKDTLQKLATEQGIAQRVHWPGMLLGDAKWGAFRSAEAFILPSHQENFGIVVAEALACGTPALITNKVNIWREVKVSGAGIVAPDTVDGVCELLRSWLEMTGDQKHDMRLRARACFESSFHVRTAANDLEAALLDATAHDRRRRK